MTVHELENLVPPAGLTDTFLQGKFSMTNNRQKRKILAAVSTKRNETSMLLIS